MARLNKFISETGICSRREADVLIADGLVTVNGVIATFATKVEASDDVRIRGAPLREKPKEIYIAFNKPIGIICTTERHIADNIIDFINHPQRIFPIGRLDKDSDGLILLTNNGDIVNEILRAENNHEKEYLVTVDRPISNDFLRDMSKGVNILDTVTKPCVIKRIDRERFCIILTQGLNRQIRRMCAVFGYRVRRLQRVRIVNIKLENLALGKWRNLSPAELRGLLPQRFS